MSFQYQTAARIVEAAEKSQGLKSYCASIENLRKSDYALAMQTLKYTEVIKEILATVEDEELENVKKSLLYVMLYEYLFGKGKIQGGGLVKRKIMQHSATFLSAKETKMQGKQHHDELLSDSMKAAQELPTYVRINEAMLPVNEGLEMLLQNYPGAEIDNLVPSLVKLPKDSKGISQAEYITDGKCVLQDKASCFPSQILFNQYKHDRDTHRIHTQSQLQQHHTYFIDACSAPGNKTSHLAALLLSHHRNATSLPPKKKANNKAKNNLAADTIPVTIYACDKSVERANLLKRRMQQYAVDGILKIKQLDFMTIDSQDSTEQYGAIEYVLLDPSCSGSGIVRNIERVMHHEQHEGDADEDKKGNKERVLRLQAFQAAILQKTLSFPNVHTVAYSTCSIHEEENEEVVVKTLQSALGQNWHLIAPIGFESWTRRGHVIAGLSTEDADKLIRCVPSDGMNGFFVALFQRNAGVTPKDIPAYVPAVMATTTSQAKSYQSEKRKEPMEKKTKVNQKRTFDTSTDMSQDENVAAKKLKKQEVVVAAAPVKKEKQPKTNKKQDAGITSLFTTKFQVSKTTKRNFHKRK